MKTKLDLDELKKMDYKSYLDKVKPEFKRLAKEQSSEAIVISDFKFACGKTAGLIIPGDISGDAQKFYNSTAKTEYKGFGKAKVSFKSEGELDVYIETGKAKPKALAKANKKLFDKIGVVATVTKNPAEAANDEPETDEDEISSDSEDTTADTAPAEEAKAETAPAPANGLADKLKTVQGIIKDKLGAIAANLKSKQASADDAKTLSDADALISDCKQDFAGLAEGEKAKYASFMGQLDGVQQKVKAMSQMLDSANPAESASDTASSEAPAAVAAASIGASVGLNGANKLADVILVQQLLNKKGAKLTADGKCGKMSVMAIMAFQKKLGMLKPDGLISPGGRTWKALSAGSTPVAPPTPVVPKDKVELMEEHQGKYDFTSITAKLFEKGSLDEGDIDPNDIQQGSIGNCYFMASIASVARANPEAIRKLIKANADGSYDVTLYSKKGGLVSLTPQIVNVRPDFATDASGNPIYSGKGDNELWVMLLEKAYAKMNGGYDDTGKGGYIEEGIEALTGKEANYYMCSSKTADELLALIQGALAAKKPIDAATSGSGEVEFTTEEGSVIYKGHAYAIKSVSGGKINLQNPWGHGHANVSPAEFKKYFNHIAF
jgi:Calpain family cysteine protease